MVKPELVVQIRFVAWTAEVDYGTRCTWVNDRIGLLGACDAKYRRRNRTYDRFQPFAVIRRR
jgi:hypothetical protein